MQFFGRDENETHFGEFLAIFKVMSVSIDWNLLGWMCEEG